MDVAHATGAAAAPDARSVAVVDLDVDGRVDLVINNNAAAPTVLMNQLPSAGRWVELELLGTRSNRDAVGAEVRLTAGGRKMTRVVEAGSGYAAQSSHVLHFGLAEASEIEALEVRWPSGEIETFAGPTLRELVPIDARSRLLEAAEGVVARSEPETLSGQEPGGAI